MTRWIEGDFSASTANITIVLARFNEFVVDSLLKGALDTFQRHGISEKQITVVKVPGAFELPLVARIAAEKPDCDAVVALGAVIRGATPHFDYVSGQCAGGIAQVALDCKKPVIFGVLTTVAAFLPFLKRVRERTLMVVLRQCPLSSSARIHDGPL